MFGNLIKPRLLRNTDRISRPNPIDPVSGNTGNVNKYLTNIYSTYKNIIFY